MKLIVGEMTGDDHTQPSHQFEYDRRIDHTIFLPNETFFVRLAGEFSEEKLFYLTRKFYGQLICRTRSADLTIYDHFIHHKGTLSEQNLVEIDCMKYLQDKMLANISMAEIQNTVCSHCVVKMYITHFEHSWSN